MSDGKNKNLTAPHRQRGLALLLVLWLVVLLSVIAAGHARNVHTETRLARHQVEIAKARALAVAGSRRAIMELLVGNSVEPWPVDGTINTIMLDGTRIAIQIRDAKGLVDLNAAGIDLLSTTLAATGTDEHTQRRIIDATMDWRDQDGLKSPYGAEDTDYQAAGLAWTARDDNFTSVDELRYVMGMTDEIFEKLAPFLTVYSGRSGINLEFAPPLLIAALTGESVTPADAGLPGDAQQATGQRRAGTYHINVRASSSGGTVASLEAVVQISSSSVASFRGMVEEPYKVLYWRMPMRSRLKVVG